MSDLKNTISYAMTTWYPWHWDLECMVDGFDPKITRPMFEFSDLGQPRVLSFSERLVNKLNQLSWSTKIDRIYSLFLCSGKNQSIGILSLLVIDSYINNLIDFSMYYLRSISLTIFFSNNPCLCSFVYIAVCLFTIQLSPFYTQQLNCSDVSWHCSSMPHWRHPVGDAPLKLHGLA